MLRPQFFNFIGDSCPRSLIMIFKKVSVYRLDNEAE
jgi:hypothetical protein